MLREFERKRGGRKEGSRSTPLVASLKLLFSGCGCTLNLATSAIFNSITNRFLAKAMHKKQVQKQKGIPHPPPWLRASQHPELGNFLCYLNLSQALCQHSAQYCTGCTVLTALGPENHLANKLLGLNNKLGFIFSTETTNFLLNFTQLP